MAKTISGNQRASERSASRARQGSGAARTAPTCGLCMYGVPVLGGAIECRLDPVRGQSFGAEHWCSRGRWRTVDIVGSARVSAYGAKRTMTYDEAIDA